MNAAVEESLSYVKGLSDLLQRKNISIGVSDRPIVDAHQQSRRKGIYIVGDLVDAAVIKVAFQQGQQLGQHLRQVLTPSETADIDVAIIGAGPAGCAAALALKESGLKTEIFDQAQPFSSIQNFMRGKKIYAQPRGLVLQSDFEFTDDTKENLVVQWHNTLASQDITIQSGHRLVDIHGQAPHFQILFQHQNQKRTRRAQVVILAIGKRSGAKTLEVPGRSSSLLHSSLDDPQIYCGQNTIVIGGGDSAAEAALALHNAGAQVRLLVRSSTLYKVSQANQELLRAAEQTGLRLHRSTHVLSVSDTGLESSHGFFDAEAIFPFLGHHPPKDLLKRLGIPCHRDQRWWHPLWFVGFLMLSYLFYVLKQGYSFFPFHETGLLSNIQQSMVIQSSDHHYGGSFWGTALYSTLIAIFGVRALLKSKSRVQKKRYAMLIGFQWVFLFGIPELISPALFGLGGAIDSLYFEFLGGMRAWKWYSLSVPWPLNIYALIDAPNWTETRQTHTVLLWLIAAAAVSFLAIPLYVKRHGLSFCSYLCGCGGLAETLGDFWRDLAPRGKAAKSLEKSGRFILFLSIPVTVMALIDAWQLVESTYLGTAASWAQKWYALMVDFGLASVLGVGLYPYLGNRFWCRFFCPLRAYMEILSKRFSPIAIEATDSCIGCGECTRYCQMGIQVQRFAQEQTLLDNRSSACIQCGVCIDVCPMDVLSIGHAGQAVQLKLQDWLSVPKAHWE